MKSFQQSEIAAAYDYAKSGGQALHLMGGWVASLNSRTPKCFKGRNVIAHLFDQDSQRLISTARKLGVRVILVEHLQTSRQHIDLCGRPLERALALCDKPQTEDLFSHSALRVQGCENGGGEKSVATEYRALGKPRPRSPLVAIDEAGGLHRGEIVKAISIRQPWAWLILHAGKDIENRTWRTHFRGRVLIHASQGMTRNEFDEAMDWIAVGSEIPLDFHEPDFAELQRGGIVGEVEIVDCVNHSDSPWFQGPYGFALRNPKPLPFVPCKGALGFFTPKLNAKPTGGAVSSGEAAG